MAIVVASEPVRTEQLCELLGVSRRQIVAWQKLGMPVIGKTKNRRYDVEAVEEWLIANGHAATEEPPEPKEETGKICRTYSELGRALGMTTKNPERQIASWATQPGFPGKPGTPSKADGFLPVDEIKEWLANREGGRGSYRNGWGGGDEEIRTLDRDRRKLLLELETKNLQEQLGRLASVDDVARFNRQCVANAVAILEPLADDVLLALPSDLGASVRQDVHATVTRLLDNARLAIAEIIEGDKDDTEENESDE